MTRRRVLLVGKGAPDRGGIAAFLDLIRESALAATYDIDFLNLAHEDVPAGGRLSAGNLGRTLADARAVLARSRGCDVVHVHSALAPLVTLTRAGLLVLAGRARGAHVVLHAHGGRVALWLTTPGRRRLARVLLAGAHRVVTVAEGGRTVLAGALGADRVLLVDNGVDTHRFRPGDGAGNDPPRVLYVGLLTPRKGVVDLIEASAILRAEGVAHELHLVGGAPDEGPEAEAAVRAAAGAGGAVRFRGTVAHDAMPATYREADVFCLPSWWEAMPLSVLEAMASGLPVVATAVGDVPRLVQDGVTGAVVAPRDPQALAAALRELLTRPERRRSWGAAGRERAQSMFSAARTLAAIAELYG